MSDVIRVFVAGTPSEWLAMRVLEFSIRETTKLPLEFSALYSFDRPIPKPQAKKNWPRTPFSFQRFLIPELCGYQGNAIYLDSDMQVFQDIGKLWNHPLGGCDLQTAKEVKGGRPEQFSVMLLNCATLNWRIEDIVGALDSGEYDYEGLLHEMCVAKKIGRDIPADWNSLESFEAETTALLHYTDMHEQPWVSLGNPLRHIWVSCLRRALAKKFISQKELEREVAIGHIRPSLLIEAGEQVNLRGELQGKLRKVDRGFFAPYQSLHCGGTRLWRLVRPWLTRLKGRN